ncbi:MAG: hypothetical protein LBC98_03215 [Prevotellaceae bacterium]|jgi:hypothetical protein|nr:hypothetical protein [Prevotellaceae bacterium]
MRKFIFIITACLALVSCRRTAKTDCEKLNLKGNVSYIIESYYTFAESSEGQLSKDKRTESETWFFDSGDQTFLMSYETRIYFDNKGRKTLVEVLDSAGINLSVRETYEYDAEGNLSVKRGFNFDSLYCRETFLYDNKNREIERVFYDMDDKMEETIQSEYFDQTVKSIVLSADADADTLEIHAILDKDGNRTDEWLKTSKGELLKRDVKVYDEKGRMTELTNYDSSKTPYQKSTCRYDEHGNEAEFVIYNLENNEIIATYKYHYIYDETGNWVEQISMMNEAPYTVTVRDIKYYK